MYDHSTGTVDRARKLRKEMSLPEILLWRLLKTKPMGLRFRNQHPVGDYVVDFYCHAASAVFEIDGIVHSMGDQPEFDERRDAELKAMGFEIIRIPAREVLADPDEVAQSIIAHCAAKAADRTH